MIQNWIVKNKSLRSILILLFSLTGIFLIGLIGIFCFKQMSRVMMTEIGNARVGMLQQIGERIEAIHNRMVTLSNLYYYDMDFNHYIQNCLEDSETVELENYLNSLDTQYRQAFVNSDYDYCVALELENGYQYLSDKSLNYDFSIPKKKLWYADMINEKGNIYWTKMYQANEGDIDSVQAAARILVDKSTGKTIGTLFILIKEKIIAETYQSALNGQNSVYILNNQGSIISHPDKNMVGINFYNMDRFYDFFGTNSYAIVDKADQSFYLINSYDENLNYIIVEETPVFVIMESLYKIQKRIMGMLLICIVITIMLAVILSGTLVKPIYRLCVSMKQMQKGDLNVRYHEIGWKEVQELGDGFNGMMEKIQMLLKDIEQKQEQKNKAEMNFLRSQINPHFIYNTLFNIKCMAAMNRMQDVENMLTIFSRILKNVLSNPKELISLEEEVSMLQQYVFLLKYRYGNNFEVIFNIDDDVQKGKIPKLSLQPILENAIFHGLEPKGGNGTVIVNSWKRENRLIVEIIDDGVGMDEEQIKNSLIGEKDDDSKQHHIGLKNVNERLKLYFGEGYGIMVKSEKQIGTTVTFEIPYLIEE